MPYSQKGVATGILFGNKKETPINNISPSLRVIMNAVLELDKNKTEKDFTLIVKDKINSSSYNPKPKYLKDIITLHSLNKRLNNTKYLILPRNILVN